MLVFSWPKNPKSDCLSFSSPQRATSSATLSVGACSSLFPKILMFLVNSQRSYAWNILIRSYRNHGLQSRGVAATIKHFVANDLEGERTATNSVISDRALREVYLYPYDLSLLNCGSSLSSIRFMLAQRDGKPWAYMTSYVKIMCPLLLPAYGQFCGRYGRLWGTHYSENPKFLESTLRGEWGTREL